MFDQMLRGVSDPILKKVTNSLLQSNITPNHLTIMGLFFGLLCFVSLFFQSYLISLLFLALNRLFDGLDGVFARSLDDTDRKGSSDFGGYFDIVSDFVFYNGFVFFFALGNVAFLLPAAFLLFSFAVTGTAFLAYAIFEKQLKEKEHIPKNFIKKSFYHLGGLTEGSETIACFALMCLFPKYFTYFACVYGVLCWITTITRFNIAFRNLK